MEWISVKKRLPKIEPGRDSSDLVLVAKRLRSRRGKLIVKMARLHKTPVDCIAGSSLIWIDQSSMTGSGIIDVVYWMPLPEPPEAGTVIVGRKI